jgi:hypothetical protein
MPITLDPSAAAVIKAFRGKLIPEANRLVSEISQWLKQRA